MFTHIVAFTRGGARLCSDLIHKLGSDCAGYAPAKYCDFQSLTPLECPVTEWAAQRFTKGDALVFIGAAGIAVRSIAPLVTSKGTDPAIVCVDEMGRFVVPLLSEHIGGANALAENLATLLNAQAVLTSATDVRQVFSVDTWATQNNCVIEDLTQIKHISATLLDGGTVGLITDFPIEGPLPAGIEVSYTPQCGIYISLQSKQPYSKTLHLIPKCLRIGIGCRKGVLFSQLEQHLLKVLEENNLPIQALESVATITLKEREPAILELCKRYSLPLNTYSSQQLMQVQGTVSTSQFVMDVTGVDTVCERAALYHGGTLLVPKTVGNGVAIAVAQMPWRVCNCV